MNDVAEGPVADASSSAARLVLLIKRYRVDAGLSQAELAIRVGYTRQYVSRAEQASKGLPSADLVAAIDRVLDAGGELAAAHAAARLERSARRTAGTTRTARPDDLSWSEAPRLRPSIGDTGIADDAAVVRFDPGFDLAELMDPVAALDAVDAFTCSVVDRYEIEGPSLLMPEVAALRRLCRALGPRVGPAMRVRLVSAAARQAGLLAYMLVNLDRPTDADSFAFEASLLATAAGDRDLQAWVKGTQSFGAYYQGRYQDALRHAHAGLRIAGDGAHRARLLANGVARAAGKLGDLTVVERAVEEALTLAAAASAGTVETLGPCIGFEPYSHARTLANAATAFLSVGRYATVMGLTDQLDAVVARSESDWSKALVRLDAAGALAHSDDGDLDHATTVGIEALAMSRTNPIASIGRRAGELVAVLEERGAGTGRGEDLREALREWRVAASTHTSASPAGTDLR